MELEAAAGTNAVCAFSYILHGRILFEFSAIIISWQNTYFSQFGVTEIKNFFIAVVTSFCEKGVFSVL